MKDLDADFEHLITLDWETFYDADYSLSKMTTEAYVRDPRFEAIGVGVKIDDGPTVWTEEADFRSWAKKVDWRKCAVLAHHAHFDGLILSHHYGIRPAVWFDTLSMGRALHGVSVGKSLEKLAVHYQVGEKGHEVENAKGKRRRDFDAGAYLRYGAYCRNDVELTYAIFQKMLARGFPEAELWNIDTTIRMFTEPSFVIDEPLLEKYLIEERARKAALLERVAKDKSTLASNDKFAALIASYGIDVPMKLSTKKTKTAGVPVYVPAFAKSDPGMQELLEHETEEIRWLAEARIGVKSTINETRTERFLRAGKGGRPVPVYLKYGAAHTFRWGGGDKMNFQNLARGGTLRDSLRAPAGKKLVVADSNAIEARVLPWFAGHSTLVEAFAQNRDVYSEFASIVYGRKIDRKRKLADGSLPDKVPGFVGKTAVLGLGYGMGWEKAAQTFANGPPGSDGPIVFDAAMASSLGVRVEDYFTDPNTAPRDSEGKIAKAFRWKCRAYSRVENMPSRLPLAERFVHCAVAWFIVRTYREANDPIVKLWKAMDEVLDAMVDGREMVFGPNGCMRTVRHGLLLPSGLVMKYPGLERKEEWDEENERRSTRYSYLDGYGKTRKHAYGGLLVENIVQALARIIVADQMRYTRARSDLIEGIACMTHDEVVGIAEAAKAPVALAVTLATMKSVEMCPWARGLPLNAEGDIGDSYGDAK